MFPTTSLKVVISLSMALLFSIPILLTQPFSVMTYNIKYDNQQGGQDSWESRRDKMVELVQHYQPAIFGIQEGLVHQLSYLDEALYTYTYTGVGRDDGQEKGEFSAIFYDSTYFELLEYSTFWLSETPDTISVGWDAALERICTYGLFQHLESAQLLWVFNTHFDHVGTVARERSAELILRKIEQINTEKLPVVLMGDFNVLPTDPPIMAVKEQLDDAQLISEQPFYGPPGTFNGFRDEPMDRRIDYIFTQQLPVHSYIHIDDRLDSNRHISDHLPVLAELELLW